MKSLQKVYQRNEAVQKDFLPNAYHIAVLILTAPTQFEDRNKHIGKINKTGPEVQISDILEFFYEMEDVCDVQISKEMVDI